VHGYKDATTLIERRVGDGDEERDVFNVVVIILLLYECYYYYVLSPWQGVATTYNEQLAMVITRCGMCSVDEPNTKHALCKKGLLFLTG